MDASASVSRQQLSIERSALINAVRVLRERWRLVVLCFLVCAIVTAVVSKTSTKQYTATSTLLIRPSNLPALVDPTQAQSQDATTLARQLSDDASLAASIPVATQVKQTLGLSESVADLQGLVVASPSTTEDLMTISITDSRPERAATLANAFGNALVSYLTQSAQATLVSGKARLETQLAALAPTDPSRNAIQQALTRITELQSVTTGGAQLVDPAAVPTSPSSPNVKRDTVVGGVVGIVLGLVLVFLLDIFDRRVKTVDELETLYGLPALTAIPLHKREPIGEREIQAELEPYRILRDGLASISMREDTRVILVTSAVPGEGKTRVASGLARALAVAGRHVVLVEADLHRPGIATEFGIQPDGRGLTSSLVKGVSPLQLTQEVPQLPTLSILPSGPRIRNSAELLGSPAMASALAELANEFEFVVLDGPPLLPVADTHALLDTPMIDVCLIVARPYLTTRDQIRGTLAVLTRHRDKGTGLVVNGARDVAADYYHYSQDSRNGGGTGTAVRLDQAIETGSETS